MLWQDFTAKELLTALAVALAKFQEGKPFFVNCLSACGDTGWQQGGTAAGQMMMEAL